MDSHRSATDYYAKYLQTPADQKTDRSNFNNTGSSYKFNSLPQNIDPKMKYSITGINQAIDRPINVGNYDEAVQRVILLSCEVERLCDSNYSLVKENEILKLQTDKSLKERELENKVAIVLAENEKLNQLVEEISEKIFMNQTNGHHYLTPDRSGREFEMNGDTKAKAEPQVLRAGVDHLVNQNKQLKQEVNELKAVTPTGSDRGNALTFQGAQQGDLNNQGQLNVLLQKNEQLNDTLNNKYTELQSIKSQLNFANSEILRLQNIINQKDQEITQLKAQESSGNAQEMERLRQQLRDMTNEVNLMQIQHDMSKSNNEVLHRKLTIHEQESKEPRNVMSEGLRDSINALEGDLQGISEMGAKFESIKNGLGDLIEARLKEVELLQGKMGELEEGQNRSESLAQKVKRVIDEGKGQGNASGEPTAAPSEEVQAIKKENDELKNIIEEYIKKPVEAGSKEEFSSLRAEVSYLSSTNETMSGDLSRLKQKYELLRSAPENQEESKQKVVELAENLETLQKELDNYKKEKNAPVETLEIPKDNKARASVSSVADDASDAGGEDKPKKKSTKKSAKNEEEAADPENEGEEKSKKKSTKKTAKKGEEEAEVDTLAVPDAKKKKTGSRKASISSAVSDDKSQASESPDKKKSTKKKSTKKADEEEGAAEDAAPAKKSTKKKAAEEPAEDDKADAKKKKSTKKKEEENVEEEKTSPDAKKKSSKKKAAEEPAEEAGDAKKKKSTKKKEEAPAEEEKTSPDAKKKSTKKKEEAPAEEAGDAKKKKTAAKKEASPEKGAPAEGDAKAKKTAKKTTKK